MRSLLVLLALLPVLAWSANDRVLVILGPQFNRGEFWTPYYALRAAGYRVDIAGIARGPVPVSDKGVQPTDPVANLTLDEVKPDDYVGLLIPGGYSPGNLEKHPKSLEICTAFMQADKPVAAICHGPRLLMRAGLMKDRVGTCLNTVANELCDEWVAGAYGKYLDEPVVVDRKLVTSRYPNDTIPLMSGFLPVLARNGGLPFERKPARVLVISSAIVTNDRWDLLNVPKLWHMTVDIVYKADDVKRMIEVPDYDLVVAPDKSGTERMLAIPEVAGLVKGAADRGTPFLVHEANKGLFSGKVQTHEGDMGSWMHRMRTICNALPVTDEPGPDSARGPADASSGGIWHWIGIDPRAIATAAKIPPATTNPTAAIALREGFDDYVFAAMYAYLTWKGHKVAIVGPAKGELRGLNGLTAQVGFTYADAIDLPRGAVIVAPGSVWPMKAEARQATQPAWIEEQDARDTARLAWLNTRYQDGAMLLTFGFDSLLVGKQPAFKGLSFAASDQCVWSFGKEGGKYSAVPAVKTADRLISAKGAGAVAETIKVFEAK